MKIKHFFLFFALFCFCFYAIGLYNKTVAIYEKKLTYDEHIGWIDWGHAQTEGTNQLLQNVEKSFQNADTVVYFQKMKIFFIYAKVEQHFKIDSLCEQNKLKTSYQIFETVSDNFEKMQGDFPFYVVPFVRNSSFSEEDLNGNKISFYCAVNSISPEVFKQKTTQNSFFSTLINYYTPSFLLKNKQNEAQNNDLQAYFTFFETLNQQQTAKIESIFFTKKIEMLSSEFQLK